MMQSTRAIRLIAGVTLLVTSISISVTLDLWQMTLSSLIVVGDIGPYSRLIFRIILLSLIVPGLVLITWEPFGKLLGHGQQYLDRLSERSFLLRTLSVAAVLRIVAVIVMPLRLYVDWATYHKLALLWASTGEYCAGSHPTGYFPPGWPFFLSRLYLIFGEDPHAGIVANIALGVGIVYLSFRLARRVWGATVARWTAVIMSVFPSQILFTNLLCSEILFTFLFLFSLDVTLGRSLKQVKALARSFLSGLLLGLATLVRSMTLVFPLAIIPVFFRQAAGKRAAGLRWLALSGGLLLVTVPWIVRNYDQVGRATISTNGGVTLFIGNHPPANVDYRSLNPANLPWEACPDEAHVDSLGYSLGWAYIWQDPLAFLKRGVLKVMVTMGSDISGLTYELIATAKEGKFSSTAWFAVAVQSFYYVILLLVAGGIIRFARTPALRNAGGYLFLLTFLYWLAGHFVFFGSGRFHFPIVPLLAGFAGLAVAGIARRRGQHILTTQEPT